MHCYGLGVIYDMIVAVIIVSNIHTSMKIPAFTLYCFVIIRVVLITNIAMKIVVIIANAIRCGGNIICEHSF